MVAGNMGLGPLAAVYQARFFRYLHLRGLKEPRTSQFLTSPEKLNIGLAAMTNWYTSGPKSNVGIT